VKFKTQIIGVVIGALLGLAIAQACATMQTQPAQSEDDVCAAIDKCIDAGYKKISFLQSGREHSSPTQPARLSLSNGVYMVDLHDRIADGFADADGVAEDLYIQFTARYSDLISNTKNRNEKMWMNLGAPINLTMGMLELVPVQQRLASDEWSSSMTAIISASRRQAFLETMMIPLLSVRDKNIEPTITAAKRMSRTELKAEARVPTETFRSASERRKSAKA
jgi:hypothetical protein